MSSSRCFRRTRTSSWWLTITLAGARRAGRCIPSSARSPRRTRTTSWSSRLSSTITRTSAAAWASGCSLTSSCTGARGERFPRFPRQSPRLPGSGRASRSTGRAAPTTRTRTPARDGPSRRRAGARTRSPRVSASRRPRDDGFLIFFHFLLLRRRTRPPCDASFDEALAVAARLCFCKTVRLV